MSFFVHLIVLVKNHFHHCVRWSLKSCSGYFLTTVVSAVNTEEIIFVLDYQGAYIGIQVTSCPRVCVRRKCQQHVNYLFLNVVEIRGLLFITNVFDFEMSMKLWSLFCQLFSCAVFMLHCADSCKNSASGMNYVTFYIN